MGSLTVSGLVAQGSDRPPLILVHGSANSARVWTFWQHELVRRAWASYAVDLRGHGRSGRVELSETRMADYVEDVVTVALELRRAPILVGWSMGGLVAIMAAGQCQARACVGLAPSTPARHRDTSLRLETGVFGPEEYGIVDRDPDRQPTMPDLDREERLIALESLGTESRLARDERKAGVVVERLGCPLLIVTGTADTHWPAERYRDLHLQADHLSVEEASHWGLVLNRRVLPEIVSSVIGWLDTVLSTPGNQRAAERAIGVSTTH
jgi:pimeloyl-ACP methyl ester carboxylesterase